MLVTSYCKELIKVSKKNKNIVFETENQKWTPSN